MSTSKTNKATAAYFLDGNTMSSESNVTTFTQIVPSLKLTKTSTPASGIKGTVITFTIVALNEDATLPANNVVLSDPLTAQGFTYVTGTLKLDGVTLAGNIETGIIMGAILPGASRTVTFDAKAN